MDTNLFFSQKQQLQDLSLSLIIYLAFVTVDFIETDKLSITLKSLKVLESENLFYLSEYLGKIWNSFLIVE